MLLPNLELMSLKVKFMDMKLTKRMLVMFSASPSTSSQMKLLDLFLAALLLRINYFSSLDTKSRKDLPQVIHSQLLLKMKQNFVKFRTFCSLDLIMIQDGPFLMLHQNHKSRRLLNWTIPLMIIIELNTSIKKLRILISENMIDQT